jgi:SPP1 gp7 family putative phage head morphogenesis protein
MSQDFRANLYPAALARIKRLERALVRDLRQAQTGLVSQLINGSGRRRFLSTGGTLQARLKAILLNYALVSFREGVHIAVLRMRKEKIRFDDREEQPETTLQAIPDVWDDWYSQTLDEALSGYTARIRVQIGNLTKQAASEGLTTEELTDKIKDLCQGLTTWQAERIARTEIMRLWNMGHLAQFEESEEIIGYSYSVVMDGRTSHFCAPLHGVKVKRDELEIVPPLHPHCRTILEPVFSFDEGAHEWTDGSRINAATGFGELPELPDED